MHSSLYVGIRLYTLIYLVCCTALQNQEKYYVACCTTAIRGCIYEYYTCTKCLLATTSSGYVQFYALRAILALFAVIIIFCFGFCCHCSYWYQLHTKCVAQSTNRSTTAYCHSEGGSELGDTSNWKTKCSHFISVLLYIYSV